MASRTLLSSTARLASRHGTRVHPSRMMSTSTSTSASTSTVASSKVKRVRFGLAGSCCLGLTLGTGVAFHSSPSVRFDFSSFSSSPFSSSGTAFSNKANERPGANKEEEEERKEAKEAKEELMKQLSSGSVAGFVSGVLLSVFSRTLVLLLGVGVVVVQIAARYGINIVDQLRLKQRLGGSATQSKILAALERNPVFKLSFGLFFALSAFMKF